MVTDPLDIDNRGVSLDCEHGQGANPQDVVGTSNLDSDIRVEYHPNSGRDHKTLTLEEFQCAHSAVPHTRPADAEPWLPFKTREDFEFAEIAQETGMSKKQIDALIHLFRKCIDIGKESFTFSNYNDMHRTLMLASERLPKVAS